jgi:hypothetical protein
MPDEEIHELAVVVAGKPVTFRYNKTVLAITHTSEAFYDCFQLCLAENFYVDGARNRVQHVPIGQILCVELAEETLEVRYLARRRKRCPLSLVRMDAMVKDASLALVWIESLMAQAFEGFSSASTMDWSSLIHISIRGQTAQEVESPGQPSGRCRTSPAGIFLFSSLKCDLGQSRLNIC